MLYQDTRGVYRRIRRWWKGPEEEIDVMEHEEEGEDDDDDDGEEEEQEKGENWRPDLFVASKKRLLIVCTTVE